MIENGKCLEFYDLMLTYCDRTLTVLIGYLLFFFFESKNKTICTGWCRGFLPLPLSYFSFLFFLSMYFFFSSIKPPTDMLQMMHINFFHITKTRLFKYIETFTSRNLNFSDKKNSNIFHISAQNIDCWYSLEPPRRGGSNEYPQSMF